MHHALTENLDKPRPTLAKIVATLGPASDSPEVIARLIEAGVSVFRLNFSHGTLDDHARRLALVREASRATDRTIGVLGDLQGPKIRVGKLSNPDEITVDAGDDLVLVPGRFSPGESRGTGGAGTRTVRLPCEYEHLAADVATGHRVLINDGAIRLLAVEREDGDESSALRCRVLVGGPITSRKGINLPDSDVRTSAITERDWACVDWAVAHGVDFLALSFVRRAEEVISLKKALAQKFAAARGDGAGGSPIPIIAKIEKPQALGDIDAIMDAADGIMVARGDLGVEMDLAQVPIVQKRLIAKADEWGKPCIVATQMLETMITAASPTRAEASDVANAILDGADAVMLSAETASGRHPTLVVETMRRIIAAAELRVIEKTTGATPSARLRQSRYRTAALAHGAWHVAHDLGARAVACWSQHGGTARYLSQTGLNLPILAYSSDERQTRRMALLRGVTAVHAEPPADGTLASWHARVEADLLARNWVKPGDPVVLLAGKPLGKQGVTNTLALHYTGNPATGFTRL